MIESVEPALLNLFEFTHLIEPKDSHYFSFLLRFRDRIIIAQSIRVPQSKVIWGNKDIHRHQLLRKANHAGSFLKRQAIKRIARIRVICNLSVNDYEDVYWISLGVNYRRELYEFNLTRL